MTTGKAVVGDHGADNRVPQYRHSMTLRGRSGAGGNVMLSILIRVHLLECDMFAVGDTSRIALGLKIMLCFSPTERCFSFLPFQSNNDFLNINAA